MASGFPVLGKALGMKNIIKFIMYKLGYRIVSSSSQHDLDELDEIKFCINILLAAQDTVNIVQVGANDGSFNDPVNAAVHSFKDQTRILLIEPQAELIPILTRNYSAHPGAFFYKGAIGPRQDLILYSIRPEYWKECDVPYARNWPVYRAPTGVTSADRSHVEDWAKRHYKGQKQLSAIIQEQTVQSLPLGQVLIQVGFGRNVDILQVDAEGYDDVVIYNSRIDEILPRLIRFESHSLSKEKLQRLTDYLVEKGYCMYARGGDGMAVLARRR
jgi:FkbM family methyltransferase